MQFIKNGPDVPDRLLQEHEIGGVVFFCGAGISRPAGLPGFAELVDDLLQELGVTNTSSVLKEALDAKKFDTSIGLLENEIQGGREAVRSCLEKLLTPSAIDLKTLSTHEALLTLAKTREEKTRLITTNFDRLFAHVISQKKFQIESFYAPLLPIPKNTWDGLVYLHGFLKEDATSSDWDRLVLSSGDFGLAYLTERWAARFVSELFRNYTVCFVGYSIDDPVLRYMMDALAADRLRGETTPEMFAFGGYKRNKRVERENEWKAKNVTPILYAEDKTHKNLHRTLREWAKTYRDGIEGKENIVAKYAISKPLASTVQDDFVGRLIWALTDPNGLPAKKFAELNPVPSLDWLEAFNEQRYADKELEKFGIEIRKDKWEGIKFSLLRRPSPYWNSPLMTLTKSPHSDVDMDSVMLFLARWLTRHLGDPNLLIWFADQGARLSNQMRNLIRERLKAVAVDAKKDQEVVAKIISDSPNYFPDSTIKFLWDLMIANKIFAKNPTSDLYLWLHNFQSEGLTTASRIELKALLSPSVMLRKAIHWKEEVQDESKNDSIRKLIDWEVVLASDHSHFAIRDFSRIPEWQTALPILIDEFNSLLLEALTLKSDLGDANYWGDRSYIDQPSISDHSQNRNFHDWTVLVVLCRDAWLSLAATNSNNALRYAEGWLSQPFPIFKRLSLFTATHEAIVPIGLAYQWLLTDDAWWFWSVETQREVMQLLLHLGRLLDAKQMSDLEDVLLSGPPKKMFRDGIEDENWLRVQDRSIWLRLSKLSIAGAKLKKTSLDRLAKISNAYPDWEILENQQDDFPYWLESGWYGDRVPWKKYQQTPVNFDELIDYLKRQTVEKDTSIQDDWKVRCKSDFSITSAALKALANENLWPEEHWRDALDVWSQAGLFDESWEQLGSILLLAPDDFLIRTAHSLSWWIESLSKTFQSNEQDFLNLCLKIIRLNLEFKKSNDLMSDVINHPIGHITEGLLRWWYRKKPEDEQGLPKSLKEIFTELCNVNLNKFMPGRVLLAMHVISLYRVDQSWTQRYLLPNFAWNISPLEALGAWEGFLWSPRLYPPLMVELKESFLDVVNHLPDFDKQVLQYASLVTFIALDPRGLFTNVELARVTEELPIKGLIECTRTLTQALESSGDQRSECWNNRVEPYFKAIWPKLRKFTEPEKGQLSEALIRLCLESREDFPSAFKLLRGWFKPVRHPFYVLQQIRENGFIEKFPLLILDLLDLLISENTPLMLTHLDEVLDAILLQAPQVQLNKKFLRLANQFRSSNG